MVKPVTEFMQIPTDNLYKFMAVFGVILTITSIAFSQWQVSKAESEFFAWVKDMNNATIDIARMSREFDRLMDKRLRLMWKTIDPSIPKDVLKSEDKMLEGESNTFNQSIGEFEKSLNEVTRKISVLESQRESLRGTIWMCRVASIIGLLLAVSGFYLWYTKLQTYQDKIVVNEARNKRRENK